MKRQKTEGRKQKQRAFTRCVLFVGLFLLLTLHSSLLTVVSATQKWSGVDESVVEKIAQERGREARDPLINTDQGDLLLFVFLLAGATGGFAAGYYWRMLIEKKGIGGR